MKACMNVGRELGNELSEGVWRYVRSQGKRSKRPAHSLSPADTFCNQLEDSGCAEFGTKGHQRFESKQNSMQGKQKQKKKLKERSNGIQ